MTENTDEGKKYLQTLYDEGADRALAMHKMGFSNPQQFKKLGAGFYRVATDILTMIGLFAYMDTVARRANPKAMKQDGHDEYMAGIIDKAKEVAAIFSGVAYRCRYFPRPSVPIDGHDELRKGGINGGA